ncbi:MAG: hypothetical protein KJ052_17010, partial [Candidatus Hydrogenedentes bacterium]|nr:hypothetical protein [Candidatus Hydrogenedentota bacterium]
ELIPEMNRWRVTITTSLATLAPGASQAISFVVETLDTAPSTVKPILPEPDMKALRFARLQPSSFKTAPVDVAARVRIRDVVASLERPKVRGLNLRAGFPQAFEDLNTLKDWGCNMIIAGMGDPAQTADFIARGHSQGMEMLLTGSGSFKDGAPAFDAYYKAQPSPQAIADSHGQDEDHYYWDEIEPVLDFASLYGKPMSEATRNEMVTYWADNFVAKWRHVQEAVRPYAPDASVWFYAPFPGVAHVDPIDSYDLFIHEISAKLGDSLTVFPFYYGIEYNQVEYMMRRWKLAGATRAVFLPMRDFMTKPSQFIRAITAARRGGADGACGFSFAVGDAPMDQQWQWRAVMLGAWANFPTQELDALILIEEPAELVEALATPGLTVDIGSGQQAPGEHVLYQLLQHLPKARSGTGLARSDLRIATETTMPTENDDGLMPVPQSVWDEGKGILQMHDNVIYLLGKNEAAIEKASELLIRIAEVARDEDRGASE